MFRSGRAKPVNFGATYGLGPKSLRAKAEYGREMTEEAYDGAGNVLTAQDPDGIYTLTYDGGRRTRLAEAIVGRAQLIGKPS